MLFFQPLTRRYEPPSTVLTSNKGFEEWGEISGDEVIATRPPAPQVQHHLPLRREAQPLLPYRRTQHIPAHTFQPLPRACSRRHCGGEIEATHPRMPRTRRVIRSALCHLTAPPSRRATGPRPQRRARAFASRVARFECLQGSLERRYFVLDQIPEDILVHAEVGVDENISKTNEFAPLDF